MLRWATNLKVVLSALFVYAVCCNLFSAGFLDVSWSYAGYPEIIALSFCLQRSLYLCSWANRLCLWQDFIAISIMPHDEATSLLCGLEVTVPIKLVTDPFAEDWQRDNFIADGCALFHLKVQLPYPSNCFSRTKQFDFFLWLLTYFICLQHNSERTLHLIDCIYSILCNHYLLPRTCTLVSYLQAWLCWSKTFISYTFLKSLTDVGESLPCRLFT
jgi:hypothetical protein